jgi:hypothetical protein
VNRMKGMILIDDSNCMIVIVWSSDSILHISWLGGTHSSHVGCC